MEGMEPAARLELLRTMVRIRAFEERVGELFVMGGTAGSMLHLSVGEEGAAAGIAMAMGPEDTFTTHHRGHGVFLARGGNPERMMAEIAGKREGYCRGKGGSMHIADARLGHLGANAIVGGGIPIAVGAALSSQLLRQDRVAVAFFGDGAMQQGVYFESMNLAALWGLPVIFAVINNQYGMGTRIDRASATLDFAGRARGFGLRAAEVDATRPEEVWCTAKDLIEGARRGEGPACLIANCYRFYGHARKDKSPYREESEEAQARQRDPIVWQKAVLEREGLLDEVGFADLVRQAEEEMDRAMRFALAAEPPPLESLFEDVYHPSTPQPTPIQQRLDRILGVES